MDASNFVTALAPIWLKEFAITGGSQVIPGEIPTLIGYGLLVVSVIVLPFLAGKRLGKMGSRKITAVLGAVSISLVTLAVIGAVFAVEKAPVEAFYGAVISFVFFGVPFQAAAGYFGWSATRKQGAHAT